MFLSRFHHVEATLILDPMASVAKAFFTCGEENVLFPCGEEDFKSSANFVLGEMVKCKSRIVHSDGDMRGGGLSVWRRVW